MSENEHSITPPGLQKEAKLFGIDQKDLGRYREYERGISSGEIMAAPERYKILRATHAGDIREAMRSFMDGLSEDGGEAPSLEDKYSALNIYRAAKGRLRSLSKPQSTRDNLHEGEYGLRTSDVYPSPGQQPPTIEPILPIEIPQDAQEIARGILIAENLKIKKQNEKIKRQNETRMERWKIEATKHAEAENRRKEVVEALKEETQLMAARASCSMQAGNYETVAGSRRRGAQLIQQPAGNLLKTAQLITLFSAGPTFREEDEAGVKNAEDKENLVSWLDGMDRGIRAMEIISKSEDKEALLDLRRRPGWKIPFGLKVKEGVLRGRGVEVYGEDRRLIGRLGPGESAILLRTDSSAKKHFVELDNGESGWVYPTGDLEVGMEEQVWLGDVEDIRRFVPAVKVERWDEKKKKIVATGNRSKKDFDREIEEGTRKGLLSFRNPNAWDESVKEAEKLTEMLAKFVGNSGIASTAQAFWKMSLAAARNSSEAYWDSKESEYISVHEGYPNTDALSEAARLARWQMKKSMGNNSCGPKDTRGEIPDLLGSFFEVTTVGVGYAKPGESEETEERVTFKEAMWGYHTSHELGFMPAARMGEIALERESTHILRKKLMVPISSTVGEGKLMDTLLAETPDIQAMDSDEFWEGIKSALGGSVSAALVAGGAIRGISKDELGRMADERKELLEKLIIEGIVYSKAWTDMAPKGVKVEGSSRTTATGKVRERRVPLGKRIMLAARDNGFDFPETLGYEKKTGEWFVLEEYSYYDRKLKPLDEKK